MGEVPKLKIQKISNVLYRMWGPVDHESSFRYKTYVKQWNIKQRKYDFVPGYQWLCEEGHFHFQKGTDVIVKVGFLLYWYQHLHKWIDEEALDYIKEIFLFDHKVHFDNLFDNQNEDLNNLLHLKRGIMQCFTGYGKTEVIATLVNYIANVLGEYVLIVVPNSNALNENWYRIKERYGIELPYFDPESKINLIACNGYPKSGQFNPDDPYFKKVQWVIADEVEYTINDYGVWIYDLCVNADKFYGFSATPDKKYGKRITLEYPLSGVIIRNYGLISYFGFSTVYKQPTKHIINLISIMTSQFSHVHIDNINELQATDVASFLFQDPKVCTLMKEICKQEDTMLIPFNSTYIIDNWIHNYFNEPDMMVLAICRHNYELYIGGEFIESISLDEVKMILQDGIATAVFGTSSVYRALDFHGIHNIMPLTSNSAGVVVQSIGRIARDVKFSVFCIDSNIEVPAYSNDLAKRKELIYNYYSECTINEETRRETQYAIL